MTNLFEILVEVAVNTIRKEMKSGRVNFFLSVAKSFRIASSTNSDNIFDIF